MTNYTKINIGTEDRAELHDKLGLTGAEVSVNRLPAGAGVPFVHSHRRNEEIYGILAGAGRAVIDGENVSLAAGDWLRSPRLPSDSSPRRRIPASPMSHSSQGGLPGRLHRGGRRRALNQRSGQGGTGTALTAPLTGSDAPVGIQYGATTRHATSPAFLF